MRITTTIILTAISLSAATSTTAATDSYIPWTFDDFDSDCQLIEHDSPQADKETLSLPVIYENDDVGELGW